MIIDVHYHLAPAVSAEDAVDAAKYPRRAARILGLPAEPDEMARRSLAVLPDPTGGKMMALADGAGIDVTWACIVDDAGPQGPTAEQLHDAHLWLAGVARRYPGRVIALAGLDPRRPDGPDILRRCLTELGMRGLKYHPDIGYDPSGPESYRLLAVLQQFDGVLLTHTGPLPAPSRCRFADPRLLADLAVDFPRLPVIAAHMGMADWRPWAALATMQPTLYGDLAMWDQLAFSRYPLFCRELRDLMDYAGADKVLFATDNPILSITGSTAEWVNLIRDLPRNAPAGIRFTDEEVEGILGGSAARILGLT